MAIERCTNTGIKTLQEFKKLEIEDIAWAKPILTASGYHSSEYNFTSAFNWQPSFQFQIAGMGGFVFIRTSHKKYSYLFPAGAGDVVAAVHFLMETCKMEGHPLVFHSVPEKAKAILEEKFPNQFEFTEKRDYFDYLYEQEKLATLAGKKLHSKRNHINRFEENYPDWHYEAIDNTNLTLAREMSMEWYTQLEGEKDASIVEEKVAITRAFDHFEELGLKGGMIFAGGKCVALSLGSPINTAVFEVHFEKAFPDIQGAYTIINREFVKNAASGYQYINREDDMGEEGLRKAKESYKPIELYKKYTAKYLGDL